MKILLAEDDLRLGKMLKTILSKNGINCKMGYKRRIGIR